METSTGAGELSLATVHAVRTRPRARVQQQPPYDPGQADPASAHWHEAPIYAELVQQWHQHGRQTPRPAPATPLPPDPGGAYPQGL
ncbi:hypothetical protein [Streptomyces sp. ODS28]|uniref:hypothetical protein n=1 Tax=Streptomyces sp. ODS28 TaxID=3136688 RepID=UPI0031F0CF51